MISIDFVSYRTLTVKRTLMIGAHAVGVVVGATQEVPTHPEILATVMSHH